MQTIHWAVYPEIGSGRNGLPTIRSRRPGWTYEPGTPYISKIPALKMESTSNVSGSTNTTDPPQGHIYGASDYAVSEGMGDYSEHGIFELDFNGDLYIRDWWRGQTKSDEWIERQCDLIAAYSPLIWFGEKGVIQKAIEPALKRRMQERNTLCRLEWLPSITDKSVRARPFQARAAMGNVFIPKHASWLPDLMSQLMKFPAGKYDDGVDVCSLIGRGLEHARAPQIVPVRKEEPVFIGSHRHDGLSWMGS